MASWVVVSWVVVSWVVVFGSVVFSLVVSWEFSSVLINILLVFSVALVVSVFACGVYQDHQDFEQKLYRLRKGQGVSGHRKRTNM